MNQNTDDAERQDPISDVSYGGRSDVRQDRELGRLEPSHWVTGVVAIGAICLAAFAAVSAVALLRGEEELMPGLHVFNFLVALAGAAAGTAVLWLRKSYSLTSTGIETSRLGRAVDAIAWNQLSRVDSEPFLTPKYRALLVRFRGTDRTITLGLVDNFDWRKEEKIRFLAALSRLPVRDKLSANLVALIFLWQKATVRGGKRRPIRDRQGRNVELAYRQLAHGQLWEAQAAFRRAFRRRCRGWRHEVEDWSNLEQVLEPPDSRMAALAAQQATSCECEDTHTQPTRNPGRSTS